MQTQQVEENNEQATTESTSNIYEKMLHRDKNSIGNDHHETDATLEKTTKTVMPKQDSRGDRADNREQTEGEENNTSSRGFSDQRPSERKKENSKENEENSEENSNANYKAEKEKLEESHKEATRWGHQKQKQLVNAKRKVSEMVEKLKNENALVEDEVQTLLSAFTDVDDNEEPDTTKENNPYKDIESKLHSEFEVFKKYSKDKDVDSKYKAFFEHFGMLTSKEQEEAMVYLQDSKPDVALDYAISQGEEMHAIFGKGLKEKGSMVKYIKSLQTKASKLEQKLKTLEQELDERTKSVYNRVKNFNESENSNKFTAREFFKQRYS